MYSLCDAARAYARNFIKATMSNAFSTTRMSDGLPAVYSLVKEVKFDDLNEKFGTKPIDASKASPSPFAGTAFKPRTEGIDPRQPIRTIYSVSGKNEPDLVEGMRELADIGRRRGFTVETDTGATPDLWAEDNALVFVNPKGETALLVSSMQPETFSAARKGLIELSGDGNRLGDAASLGRAFVDGLSSRVGDSAEKSGFVTKRAQIALDGGNVLATSNSKGEPVAIIGRNSLLVNWLALKQEGRIEQADVDRILNSRVFDPALARELRQLHQASGKPIDEAKSERMAAEIEVTKRKIAEAINLDASHVVFVEQSGFHIDMETRPLAPGVVMVSDLKNSLAELDKAISELKSKNGAGAKGINVDRVNKQPVSAESDELVMLTDLRRRTARAIVEGGQDLLDKKSDTLTRAGFRVVRAATNYGGIGTLNRMLPDVNFANGIAATDKNGKAYFITNRSSVASLNDGFLRSMKAQGIEVEFVATGQLLSQQGGLDCVTLHKKLK